MSYQPLVLITCGGLRANLQFCSLAESDCFLLGSSPVNDSLLISPSCRELVSRFPADSCTYGASPKTLVHRSSRRGTQHDLRGGKNLSVAALQYDITWGSWRNTQLTQTTSAASVSVGRTPFAAISRYVGSRSRVNVGDQGEGTLQHFGGATKAWGNVQLWVHYGGTRC